MHIGAYEAKTHLPKLLERAQRGEHIIITKHGIPIAKLVPTDRYPKSVAEAIEGIRRLRKGNKLEGVTIKELIEEGRR